MFFRPAGMLEKMVADIEEKIFCLLPGVRPGENVTL